MQIFEIVTDDTLRETLAHGTTEFPFEYYFDDIKKYDKQYVEWHWHNEFEFCSVEKGPIDLLVGQERIRMQEGDGIFINSGIIHRFEAPQEGLMPNILFAPEFIAAKHTAIYKNYIAPIALSKCSYIMLHRNVSWQCTILDLLDIIYEKAQKPVPMGELFIQNLVSKLWLELFPNIHDSLSMPEDSKNARTQARLQIMLHFIHEHYAEKITLEEIANSANISKSEALRCFRFGVWTTPVDYLIQYRLNRAKELLLSTKSSVTEIALETGFENAGYFDRIFKKNFSVTPTKYRHDSSLFGWH
ncbi:helix-turn-helix transcriptional regulator [Konateibacter massiliensis]|uniref:helix-turn-helix transcriptional regulator n=1 Tax=Konateibacter massiliensis TaxID=2002841 RepID=UPI000C152A8C|nr:AraC family transcriptional regulator [Konateibacter massiliensis]